MTNCIGAIDIAEQGIDLPDKVCAVGCGNQVETVTAEGTPVTFRHRPEGSVEYIEGKAGRALYQVKERRVDLYRNVTVQRGRDTFRAAVAHYDLEKRNLIAEGDAEQRAYVALVPRARGPLLPEARP